MEKKSKRELVNLILEDDTAKSEEEEIVHLLLQEKVTRNINKVSDAKLSFGDRLADNIAQFAGSWRFIIIFVSFLAVWILGNALALLHSVDPYPFILLNLMLSCVAALQAPVIMMSQNRQEEKDRLRAQNDYKVNLKSEVIIEDLHQKLDQILENQSRIQERLSKLEKTEGIHAAAARRPSPAAPAAPAAPAQPAGQTEAAKG